MDEERRTEREGRNQREGEGGELQDIGIGGGQGEEGA